MTTPALRLGTRGSRLALVQADAVRAALIAVDPSLEIETVIVRTTGDKVTDRPLADIGGKGLFTKEIDEALLDGRIDFAVHSMKDVPTWLPDGIVLAAMLPREDPRDVLVSATAPSIDALPEGAVVGTASLRRQSQVLARRPDLSVVNLRGNVETRIQKARDGEVAATLLALAGLKRLGLADAATAVIETDALLPAVGQGAVGIACREADDGTRGLLAAIDDAETTVRVTAERAMLDALEGSCRTPIAGLAEVAGGRLGLRGLVGRPDGSEVIATTRDGTPSEAAAMGRDAGDELRRRAGPGFFDEH